MIQCHERINLTFNTMFFVEERDDSNENSLGQTKFLERLVFSVKKKKKHHNSTSPAAIRVPHILISPRVSVTMTFQLRFFA